MWHKIIVESPDHQSMDDSSNGRVVALYPVDPGSNPRSGFIWDPFVSATCIDGCIMSNK